MLRKILIPTFLTFVFLLAPATVAAQADYGCGSYGAGNYQENCADTDAEAPASTGADKDKKDKNTNETPDTAVTASDDDGPDSSGQPNNTARVLLFAFSAIITVLGLGWFLLFFLRRRQV